MNVASPVPAIWTERYEALRQFAQDGSPLLASRPVGWILLVRHGMGAWMRRWTEATEPSPTPAPGQRPAALPAPVWQTQLTALLAHMTAAHLSPLSCP